MTKARDFTLEAFAGLLDGALTGGYEFRTFDRFLQEPSPDRPVIVLRHDVDKHPARALRTAEVEHERGIVGSYYFRTVGGSFDPEVIRSIHALGHEIGYHYEDLTLARGDVEAALRGFERNLGRLRSLAPVTTICMHGSPMSRWDNRAVWEHDTYARYGIVGEPYFDIDFGRTVYLTDTGRRWDGAGVSVRDKVDGRPPPAVRSTADLAASLRSGALGPSVMITVHPQRWVDELLPWLAEGVMQPAKNSIKRWIVRRQVPEGARAS